LATKQDYLPSFLDGREMRRNVLTKQRVKDCPSDVYSQIRFLDHFQRRLREKLHYFNLCRVKFLEAYRLHVHLGLVCR